MRLNKFLKVASICSFLGAITTILLIYLPNPSAAGLEAQAALHTNNLYMAKLWILFLHPQFNVLAVMGIAALFINKYPEFIIPGTLAILVWGFTEMMQQAFMIDTVNQIWRPEFLTEPDGIQKTTVETKLSAVSGIWDFMYFLIIFGFGLGTLLMGLVLIKSDQLARWIGLGFIFIGILSLSSFLRYYVGLSFLSKPVDWVYTWIYGVLQPLVRIALGIWLWRKAKFKVADNLLATK